MAAYCLFEFFEIVVQELNTSKSRVITASDLTGKGKSLSLIDELRELTKEFDSEAAINKSVALLETHFTSKGYNLPFSFNAVTKRFDSLDDDYLKFIVDMISIRSVGKRSRDFECSVAERLKLRTTGAIHRVGFPRDQKKKKNQFLTHLKTLGFKANPDPWLPDKDGGLDILWVLPLGSIPHAPILSLQCKNGNFNMADADKSVMAGNRSLGEHAGLQAQIHVPCVLFNDYIYLERLVQKGMNWVPLGLSDLARLTNSVSLELI
ncbi:MAG: hypothetical protein KA713_13695 [Chryseotalea sp. WA131a]|nr:MAG: hypothetical protein KA713_13695 [Chryseotalea sp. WA131a]